MSCVFLLCQATSSEYLVALLCQGFQVKTARTLLKRHSLGKDSVDSGEIGVAQNFDLDPTLDALQNMWLAPVGRFQNFDVLVQAMRLRQLPEHLRSTYLKH